METNKTTRLDQYLVDHQLVETRNKAAWMIEQGWVFINGKVNTQKSFKVSEGADVIVKPDKRVYVSQGGYKLEKAIRKFELNFEKANIMDVGASTGGFTDCALQHGAQLVVAIDIGEGQLHADMKKNTSVVSLEKTDIRTLDPEALPTARFDYILVDVSFMSLGYVFPYLKKFLSPDGMVIALLKPQFEQVERRKHKNGIIKSEKVRLEAIQNVQEHIVNNGFEIQQMISTDADGKEKNIEYLLLLKPVP